MTPHWSDAVDAALDAAADRDPVDITVYPVEQDALHECLIAVGHPEHLPGWYDELARMWFRIERAREQDKRRRLSVARPDNQPSTTKEA